MECPVCEHSETRHFAAVAGRDYWRCGTCGCTFLQPDQRPGPAEECAEYQLHRNTPDDAGYLKHLGQLTEPLLQRLAPSSQGMDYGCGPGPVLAQLLREAGHHVALYDPFFHPDAGALSRDHHFITCTEVAEHFHHPAAEFRRLHSLLKPGGWLGLMTRFQDDDARFAQWHYRRDPTHVVFYRAATFHWLARRHGWHCDIPRPNVVLMQRGT